MNPSVRASTSARRDQGRRMIRTIFFNAERLRLGWRVILGCAVPFLISCGSSLVFLLGRIAGEHGRALHPVLSLLSGALEAGLVLAFIRWLRTAVDHRPFSELLLTRAPLWGPLSASVLAGALAIAAVFFVEWRASWVELVATSQMRSSGAFTVLIGALVYLRVGFVEELGYRGYLFVNLAEVMPRWAAIVLTGVLFGASHFVNSGFSAAFVLSAMLDTALMVRLRDRFTLWAAVGFHAGWDWAQSQLFGLAYAHQAGASGLLGRVVQHGPSLWVGRSPSVESGLLYVAVELVALAGLMVPGPSSGTPLPESVHL